MAMTTEESTRMRPDKEAEYERLAEEAYERIKTGQHWRDWTYVAQGLAAGRQKAMREAHTNQPSGRGYNEAFSRWMNTRPWARSLDKATRAHLLWVADHLVEIEGWRETLAQNQRDQWNHPTTVRRAYERAKKQDREQTAGEESKPSTMAQLKTSLVESQEEAATWKRRAEESGSLFDLRRDTPEDIARALVESCTPSRAEKIAKAIRDELKRQKAAHAG